MFIILRVIPIKFETLKPPKVTRTAAVYSSDHREHIFTRDETGSVYLPTQLERTLQLYW